MFRENAGPNCQTLDKARKGALLNASHSWSSDSSATPVKIVKLNLIEASVAECGTSREVNIKLISGECKIPKS